MRVRLILILVCLPLFVAVGDATRAAAPADAAKALVKRFAVAMQAELLQSLNQGGAQEAIPVCSRVAPEIASRLSRESGALVRRVSLKLRNPANMPDAWEQAALRDFDAAVARGVDPATLVRAETVQEPAGRYYRLIKAIPTKELCLVCHGTAVQPATRAVLDARYPHDAARGYRVGQVRGAFSVKMPLQ